MLSVVKVYVVMLSIITPTQMHQLNQQRKALCLFYSIHLNAQAYLRQKKFYKKGLAASKVSSAINFSLRSLKDNLLTNL